MCDLGSMASLTGGAGKVYSSPIGPTLTGKAMGAVLPSGLQTTGELLKGGAGALASFGEASAASDLAAQREARIGQILAATKQSIELKSIEQGRDRGTRLAQIGRAGVKLTGSAADFINEQDRLDTIALETAKQQGIVQIKGEEAQRKTEVTSSRAAMARGIAKGVETGMNAAKGFGF